MPWLPLLPVLLAPPAAASTATSCTTWEMSEILAECELPDVAESSGVAWSRTRPGVWFTHNDAGGQARLYAFKEDCTDLGVHEVTGGAFDDWEDLAAGPCPAGTDATHCLYIADTGDNSGDREEIVVYVVAEPAKGEDAPVLASWHVRYPGFPLDSEALAVHPCTGALTLITKDHQGAPRIYRFPAEPTAEGEVGTLTFIAELEVGTWLPDGAVNSADWSPGGDRFVFRTYGGAWEWVTDPADPDAHWGTEPSRLFINTGGQGESISYHPDGGLLTTTERVPMILGRLACATSEEVESCYTAEPIDTGDTGVSDTGVTDTGPRDSSEPDTGHLDTGPADTAATDSGQDPLAPTGCGCGGGSAAWSLPLLLWGWRRRREDPSA